MIYSARAGKFASTRLMAYALSALFTVSHALVADAQAMPPVGIVVPKYEKTVAREWLWRLWEKDTLSANDLAAEFKVNVVFGQTKTKQGTLYWVIDKVESTKFVCRGLVGAITGAHSQIKSVGGYQHVTLNIEVSFHTGKVDRVSRSGLKAGINYETMRNQLELTGKFDQEWAIREELPAAEMTVRRSFTFRTNNGFIEGKIDGNGDPSQAVLDSLPNIDGVLSGPWDMQRLYIEHTDKNLVGILTTEFN